MLLVGLLQLNYTQKLVCNFKSKTLAKSQQCVLQIHTTIGQLLVTHSQAVFVTYASRDIWSAPEFFPSLLSCSTMTWVPCRLLSCLSSTCACLQSSMAYDEIKQNQLTILRQLISTFIFFNVALIEAFLSAILSLLLLNYYYYYYY